MEELEASVVKSIDTALAPHVSFSSMAQAFDNVISETHKALSLYYTLPLY